MRRWMDLRLPICLLGYRCVGGWSSVQQQHCIVCVRARARVCICIYIAYIYVTCKMTTELIAKIYSQGMWIHRTVLEVRRSTASHGVQLVCNDDSVHASRRNNCMLSRPMRNVTANRITGNHSSFLDSS
jgi:hypothetical protein